MRERPQSSQNRLNLDWTAQIIVQKEPKHAMTETQAKNKSRQLPNQTANRHGLLQDRAQTLTSQVQRRYPAAQENSAPTKPKLDTHVITLAWQHRQTNPLSRLNAIDIHSTESRPATKSTPREPSTTIPPRYFVQPKATKNVFFVQSTRLQAQFHPAQGHLKVSLVWSSTLTLTSFTG